MNSTTWYQTPVESVFEALGTGKSGLTANEAKARLEKYGYNELKFKRRGLLVRFLLQFHNSLIYVLLVAALITAIVSMLTEENLWADMANPIN